MTKAATRNGLMYATWQDCSVWFDGQSPCSASIRLVKVNPGLALTVDVPTGPIIDRTFGFHTLGEGDQEVIGYGVPAVEVNKHSDAVVVYQRVGGSRHLARGALQRLHERASRTSGRARC